ncbi:glycoside hydrolase family 27 protein [Pinibacter soli]|uniref:Alpha-galactosidase n=1 Tax=Pinibacter soli TaxID=3044211 RepID=A0ABT6REN8_9BACT|nr:glycoside hydrolase family 27 protein [Pinibacter soli]MDI3321039.1 glycoside hydrolase family 27 protein [Pinibacter soli]
MLKTKKRLTLLVAMCLLRIVTIAQTSDRNKLAPTPPMGWMSWSFFAEKISEQGVKEMADAMVSSGMAQAGYKYIFIDDCWQGGRDNRNNIIPDPKKFPSGIKALADYVHSKGLKLGIYSDAAPLTCAGFTASLNFEEKDAKTFASWGIDYLKYDYCGAPEDSATAKLRYKKMADALSHSGRDIALGICEWGDRQPWNWAANAGGSQWRMAGDLRDKWQSKPGEPGMSIMQVVKTNGDLAAYAGPGHWNDPDMLMIGLYGVKGPSADLGGTGCTDVEYQSQMSLWSIMASPLIASNDLRNMSPQIKTILTNAEVIAIDQDVLGKQGIRKVSDEVWDIFVKPLANGDVAIAVLNKDNNARDTKINFVDLGINGKCLIRDLWAHANVGTASSWKGNVQAHETKMFRLTAK